MVKILHSNARDAGMIPDVGTKIAHAVRCGQEKKNGSFVSKETFSTFIEEGEARRTRKCPHPFPGHLNILGRRACGAKSLQLCPTLCDPVHCSLPGSSVRGLLQARILEWAAMSSSRASSPPRDQTCVSFFSCFGRQVLYH